ncbi:hypothetical protein OHA21_30655 [Actinoplanes sp. NBC_00393]|uniref:hypothetical protein n=1 Tax=Actinoplanes sp. NBC_00393 TaxID=2975953 RepID=UPI002E1D8FFD
MTDHAQPRFWSGIDIPKTLAGTLAAVSAAVAGSFLGIAGTLIGAAVVSLISSIGTELYHRSIDRGAKRLQSAFVTAPAAVGTPEVAATHEPPSSSESPRKIHWKRVGMVAAALFVLGLGTLTAIELVAGRSAADALSGRGGDSPPSLFNTSNTSDSSDEDAEQTDSGEPSAPATEPTGETGETSTEPADPPASPAPAGEPQTTTEPQPETTTAPEENQTGVEGQQPAQELPEQQEGS